MEDDVTRVTHDREEFATRAAGVRRDQALVVALVGEHAGRKYKLGKSATLGRSSATTIPIIDEHASRLHAEIEKDDEGYYITDLGSRNGTTVNGATITRHRLAFGDRIQVGDALYLFTHYDPLEEQIVQRQKLEAIGRLGTGIAHDFNNLLAAVNATVEYLAELDGDLTLSDDDVQECLADITMASRRATEVTQRLLGFARHTDNPHGLVDISSLLGEVTQLARRTFDRRIEIVGDLNKKLNVDGDRTRLHQMFMNLCINARDAMTEGGVLRVSATLLEDVPPIMEGQTLAPPLLITVSDTGVGMDEQTRRKAFEPFFSTKPGKQGSGLGLATVYEVVKNHGGQIQIESEPGRGTCFYIYLPASVHQGRRQLETLTHSVVTGPRKENLRILLVDDEDIVRRSGARVLKSAGHRVVEARDGEEAMLACAACVPDIVLLDMNMPGKNGEETFVRLRDRHPELRVLFVSGYWDEHQEERLNAQGAAGFVQKPYRVEELLSAISQHAG